MSNDELSRFARLRRFLKEEAWLVIGCVVVLLLVRGGASDAETPEMQKRRREIEQLSRFERDQLREHQNQLRRLNLNERKSINELHEAVNRNPDLDRTLIAFHDWLASIPTAQRDEILSESDTAARIELIKSLRQQPVVPDTGSRDRSNGTRRIDGPFSPRFMNPLSPQDLDSVMTALARWVRVPVQPAEATPESILRHHITILDRVPFRMRGSDRPANLKRRGEDSESHQELRQIVIGAVSNNMKIPIMKASDRSPFAIATLLTQSIISVDVKRLIDHRATGSDEPLETIRKHASARVRESLDAMPAEVRQMRLRTIWLEQYDRELSIRLMKYMKFPRQRYDQRSIREPFNPEAR